MKNCRVIASDKSNLLRKVDYLLKSCFPVKAFFIPLEVGYLVRIVVNSVYKYAQQLLSRHKIISDWLVFSEYFPDWWFRFIMLMWPFTIFQSRIPKWLLSNSKAINRYEGTKRRQIVPILKVVSATFLLVYFVCLKKSACKTRKNVFYFTSKALRWLKRP